MIVITGASGMVGTPAIRQLRARGQSLRALTSSATSAGKLETLGVAQTVLGDFRNPADLRKLMRGVETVVHVPPSVVEDEDHIGFSMIDAAKAAGVAHFVFVSCFHPQISELRHHRNKLAVEDALIKSGLSYTILQPAMFMQNLGFIWPKVEQGIFEWPWDPAPGYTMLDTDDLGTAIVAAVCEPRLRGGTYELCAGAAISGVQMAAELAGALGRPVRAQRQSADEWAAGMKAAGASAWTVETVLGMCRFHDAHGYDGGNSVVLEAVIGRRPRSYREFAEAWVAAHRH